MLQVAHRVRGPDMVLAAQPESVVAADFQRRVEDRRIAEGVAVTAHRLLGDLSEADALDGRRRSGEIAVDELARQADGIEDLGAAIGLVGRDPHLGDDLEEALVDRLDVALDDFLVGKLLVELVLHGEQRLEGEIRVDRLGAVAGEQAEMMHLAGVAGLDDQADGRAETDADQMMVDAGGGEQRRDRNALTPDHAVRQDDDVVAGVDGGLGELEQPLERIGHSRRAGLGGVGDVERLRLEGVVVAFADGADLLEVLVGEDRLAHLEALEPAGSLEVEQVRPRADERHQAHHQLLADRVDRRVGDLGEVLLEIGVEQLRLARQRRDRRVIAHRADRFLPGHRHRRHQDARDPPGCSRRPAGDRGG